MNLRKLSIVLAVLVLVGGIFLFNFLKGLKEPPALKTTEKSIKSVPVMTAKRQSVQMTVPFTGKLLAKERIDLFAEVTGVMKASSKPFKDGSSFGKGQLLMRMDDSEERQAIVAQKSALLTSITNILPDLKLDYPEAFEKWQNYTDSFSVHSRLKPLPTADDKKLSYFISSRNILNPYYTIKSRETRLRKYAVYAPFAGTLMNTTINQGALVRAGQKVGEFLSNGEFELSAQVDVEQATTFSVGESAKAYFPNLDDTLTGKVVRIAPSLDPNTQSLTVYIAFKDKALIEGLFGEGHIVSKKQVDAFVVPRSTILNQDQIYIVKDSVVKTQSIRVLAFQENKAVIQGLPDNATILTQSIPSLYDGLTVLPVFETSINKKKD